MALAALPDRGFNETPEQGMTGAGCGGEFRVELATEKPRVIGQLDHFHQPFIQRMAGQRQTGGLQRLPVTVVEFVTVAVALGDHLFAVSQPGE